MHKPIKYLEESHECMSVFEKGAKKIKSAIKNLSATPGVYRMYNQNGDLLYVGKARDLPKRVTSYTRRQNLSTRIQRMVAATDSMQFIHTHTESEALLLEANLIKKEKPFYNILMRDDKSYSMILIREDTDFPQILKHRGAQKIKGKYFGPFASTKAVNQSLALMERVFLLRNCSDSQFKQRTRPCLQYHIKRCSAPCVGYISKEEYHREVKQAQDFLQGKAHHITQELQTKMQQYAIKQEYEKAAKTRDRIEAMSKLYQHQNIRSTTMKNADIFALKREGNASCVSLFFYRHGQHYGSRALFPKHVHDVSDEAILSALIAQFYTDKPAPSTIIVSHIPEEKDLIERMLSEDLPYKTRIICPKKGDKKISLIMHYKMQVTILNKKHFNMRIKKNYCNFLQTYFILKTPLNA